MDYRDLLDFKNQRRVDDVYNHMNEEERLKAEEAYQEITQRNQTRYQSVWMKASLYLDTISQLLGIVGMILFAILFIMTGSFILSVFFMLIHIVFIGAMGGLYNWLCGIGIGIYDWLFGPKVDIMSDQILAGLTDYATKLDATFGFYVIGLTTLFIVLFTIIYIASFFKKVDEKKSLAPLSLSDSYRILQVSEDDSFDYIRFCFSRKFKRRHRDYFERYYRSYLTIFENYQDVEGTFLDLTGVQKLKICFFTIVNVVKNILGSFARPIYFSMAIMIFYTQNFTYTDLFTLELFLKALPFGEAILSLIESCYRVVMVTPFSSFVMQYDLEFAKVLSFCICMSVIWFICSVFTYKILECVRQYQRRLHYYLKMNQGIYDEKKKYAKSYRYTIQFLALLVLLLLLWLAQYSQEIKSSQPLNDIHIQE